MRTKPSPMNGALLLTPALSAADAPGTPALRGAVTGTSWFVDLMTGQPVDGPIVDASFTVTEFRASDADLLVTGTLTGTCTAGETTGPAFTEEVTTTVTPTVVAAPGACLTLCLAIGAMQLGLRGLVVHTDDVVIEITAESGSGHLLGNLLGAVGSALSSGAAPAHVAELLNQFVTISG